MADCKKVFEDTISEILGTKKNLTDPQWLEIKALVDSWTTLMEELGLKADDPIVADMQDKLRNAKIPFVPNEKRVKHVNTMLDMFLENYAETLTKQEGSGLLRKWRNQQSIEKVKELLVTAADGIKAKDKNVQAPGIALVRGLRDLLSSAADNSKKWMTLEDRMNTNFVTYFNQLFIKRLQDQFPDENIAKLLNQKGFMDDVITEVVRTDADISSNKFMTGNKQAQAVAEALIEANGQLITHLQRKGASVNMKANEILPLLNWAKIKKWGRDNENPKESFVDYLSSRLHDDHGTAADKRQYATDLYDTMDRYNGFIEWTEVHGALDKVEEGMSRHGQRPMLKLRDGVSWNEVNNSFGERNFMATMTGQFKFLSKTLALTDMFGPEWRMNWDKVMNFIATSETGGQTVGGGTRIKNSREYKRALNTFEKLTAGSHVPGDFSIDSLLRTGRSIEVSNKLGSATLSALMDPVIISTVVRRLYGVSFFRNIDEMFSGFTNEESKKYARALGTAVDGMMGTLQDRFTLYDDWHTLNSVQRGAGNVAHFIMKWSGLEGWTDSMKTGVTSIFRSAMGDMIEAGTKWADLDSRFRGTLERFAIDEGMWNAFNKSHLDENKKFDVFKISNLDQRKKITAWFKDAVDTAVITPSLRDTEYGALLAQPGTRWEEIAKTLLQFKTFPITFTRKILARTVATQTPYEAMITLAQYTAMGVLMGMVVTQMKQISSGKQPYSLDSTQLYTQAAFYASPLGMFQDLIMQLGGENLALMAFGKRPRNIDVSAVLLGPLFSDMEKLAERVSGLAGAGLANFGFANKYEFDPEKTLNKELSKLSQWALTQVPGQNLWYAKSIYKLSLADALHEMMDPEGYKRKQYNMMKDAKDRVDGKVYNPFGEWLNQARK